MNRLKTEKSAYLLQHAENPVNWYPWCDEAFVKASKEDKPILLSIGYSACHWCHVMAHESFEDDETAKIMNTKFINIKLDKEERPDLDKIYQTSQTIITGKTGGWPLTVFMTPSKIPFFAGTYFPNIEKHGLPSFKDILTRVSDFYKDQKKDIELQNIQLSNIFKNLNQNNVSKNLIDKDFLLNIQTELVESLDNVHGGFGSAPKFPHTTNLIFLCKSCDKNNKEIINAIDLTVSRMCYGGIYDHVKGGFFRYSVDELWMIPHFEKMLYDNGPMLELLSNIYKLNKNNLYIQRIEETCEWLLDDMQDNNGGFYSTIDADSEGSEGKFYIWSEEEITTILNKEEQKYFKDIYSVYDKPNFEGKYHLHITKNNQVSYIENYKITKVIRKKLLEARNTRKHPGVDKKILASWNSLLIIGLLSAFEITNNEKYYHSAKKCFDFIKNEMFVDGKLYSCYHDEPCFDGYLDDYALLSKASIQLLKIYWSEEIFNFLIKLTNYVIKNFYDNENGGFYFTSSNHEELIYRPKSYMDDSLPAGNSIMVEVLHQLYELTGNKDYSDIINSTIESMHDSLKRSSFSHCSLYVAVPNSMIEKKLVIIRVSPKKVNMYRKKLSEMSLLNDNIYIIEKDIKVSAELISNKKDKNEFTAYVCKNHVCLDTINSFNELCKVLS